MEYANTRYIVNDVQRAMAFYVDNLGFLVQQDASPAFAAVTRGPIRLLLSGPTSSGARPLPDGRRPIPGGWNRLELIVDDIAAEVERLRANGVTFRSEIVMGPGGSQIVLDDPFGNPIELFTPTAHGEVGREALVLGLDDLPRTAHAHEFVGADHGDVPFSVILVHAQPGTGPRLHRHPYAEVFVVERGHAEFQVGDETFSVGPGQIVVRPPNRFHGFRNDGAAELRLTAIHGASRFETEWLVGPDAEWTSPGGRR